MKLRNFGELKRKVYRLLGVLMAATPATLRVEREWDSRRGESRFLKLL